MLTISTLSTTPLGSFTVTVTGTGGGLSGTTQFILAVELFDFSVSSSGSIIGEQGGSGSNMITVLTVAGSTQSVTVSVSGLPTGASPSFGGNPVCGGAATCTLSPPFTIKLTISASSSTLTGLYTLTVTGAGGGQMHTTQFLLAIGPPGSIGGILSPVNKLALLAPFLGLGSIIVAGTIAATIFLKRRRKENW
jgi:hypothetical protein